MVFLLSFPNVSIVYRGVGGIGDRAGWGGMGQGGVGWDRVGWDGTG